MSFILNLTADNEVSHIHQGSAPRFNGERERKDENADAGRVSGLDALYGHGEMSVVCMHSF